MKKDDNYKSDEPCIVCGEDRDGYVCYHHLQSRKSGGTDEKSNLMPLCLKHHNEIHTIGRTSMAEKRKEVRNWLLDHSWEYSKEFNDWFPPTNMTEYLQERI